LFQTQIVPQGINAIYAHVLNYVASESDHGSILHAVECLLKLLLVCPTGLLAVGTHEANHEALKEFNEI
jgi:hypothetical protein